MNENNVLKREKYPSPRLRTIQHTLDYVVEDRHSGTQGLAAALCISNGNAKVILTHDLVMYGVSCQRIPRLLSPGRVQRHVTVC